MWVPSCPFRSRRSFRLRSSFDSPLSLLLLGQFEISFSLKGSVMVKTFRVLVANKPKLMRELLLETSRNNPGSKSLVRWQKKPTFLTRFRRPLPTSWSLRPKSRKRPAICDALLHDYPELRIIAVVPHENYTVCYWASLDIHSGDIESSEEGLLTAVRKWRRTNRERRPNEIRRNSALGVQRKEACMKARAIS